MEPEAAKWCVNVSDRNDGPGKGSTQQPTKCPEARLHAEVGATVLVLDVLRRVRADHWQGTTDSTRAKTKFSKTKSFHVHEQHLDRYSC